MKLKTNKIAFIFLGIVAVILLGYLIYTAICPPTHLENNVLQIAGSYSIPGMQDPDLKGSSQIEVLERDSYGRILYSYSCYNSITAKDVVAIAICQKSDRDYVYFYEDICYILGEYEDGDVDALKATNDWESPYNESKMSRRKIKYTFDLQIIDDCDQKFYTVQKVFVKAVGIKESNIYNYGFVDYDANGLAVYFFAINNEDGTKNQYYVISNDSYEISYIRINQLDDIVSFKKENGWKYGY
ncbi:MAG: hypothetical protein IJ345_00365 [Clostridia bacterium]|nr:hypothetical protein [Clostridia bacterium]